jgi:RNA polymerase sigma factor (TIGR02999 family)
VQRDITTLLRAGRDAEPELWPIVYQELKSLARAVLMGRRRAAGPQTTTLVHEAYLRLVDHDADDWNDRRHFYAVAARAMRSVLVDEARRRLSAKRGSGRAGVTLSDELAERVGDPLEHRAEEVLGVHQVLDHLVLEAAALEPGERAQFLDGLTGDEGAAAEEVRRRLRAAEAESDRFLVVPATDLLEAAFGAEIDPEPPDPPDGGERYEIGECLGAGGTLAERTGSLGVERSVALLVQVAEGLHAAHREGLLHGDVKPSNVLVEETPDGELHAWIGDFGIATETVEDGPTAGPAG